MRTLIPALTLLMSAATLGAQAVPASPQAAQPEVQKPAPKIKPRVKLETSYGPVVLELEPDLAPLTVANFLDYVKAGHYAGTIFHRVIDGFMIQGGGMGEDLREKPTRAPVRNESPSTFRGGLGNARGTIAMARTDDPDSATAQFYINTVDNRALDFRDPSRAGIGYCAFGRVVEGMEAVDKISKVRTVLRRGMSDVPELPVRIKSAAVLPQ